VASVFYSVSALAAVLAAGVGAKILPQKVADVQPAATAPAAVAQAAAPSLNAQQIAQMRQALEQAPAHGFAAHEFTPPGVDALLASSDPSQRQRGEGLLKTAVLRYAAAVHRGRLNVSDFDDEWGLRPAAYDPAPGLEAALATNQLQPWLDGQAPAHAAYRDLMKGLAAYRGIASRGGWQPLPAGSALRQGMHDPRVPLLRARLAAEDPSIMPGAASDTVMDAKLTEALKAFQVRHGLTGDGELGKPTLAALNVPVEERLAQISANMERWRWMPAQLPGDSIQVNIAAAQVAVYQGGQEVLAMKAAPGRPADHTPMLMSQVRGVVINPPWNIPDSIAKKEILPKAAADPGYMAREDIHWVPNGGGQRLQQAAGPKSALGQIKFDFDNKYGVYLHDTPSRAAFEKSGRMVSHGCVRLEKPKDLAALLLNGQGEWNPELIDAKIEAGDTEHVALSRPVSVFLVYWTAFTGPDGAINFAKDSYDWDHELLQKISGQKYSNA
jgi:murein L,D-transpeptidase YcbB/YkuD